MKLSNDATQCTFIENGSTRGNPRYIRAGESILFAISSDASLTDPVQPCYKTKVLDFSEKTLVGTLYRQLAGLLPIVTFSLYVVFSN